MRPEKQPDRGIILDRQMDFPERKCTSQHPEVSGHCAAKPMRGREIINNSRYDIAEHDRCRFLRRLCVSAWKQSHERTGASMSIRVMNTLLKAALITLYMQCGPVAFGLRPVFYYYLSFCFCKKRTHFECQCLVAILFICCGCSSVDFVASSGFLMKEPAVLIVEG